MVSFVLSVRAEVSFQVLESSEPGPTLIVYSPENGAGSDVLRQLGNHLPKRGRMVLAQLHEGLEITGPTKSARWQDVPTFSALTTRFSHSQILVFREDVEAHAYDPQFRGDTVQGVGEAAAVVLKALRSLEKEIEGKDWKELPGMGPDKQTVVTTNSRLQMEAGLRPAVRERELRTATTAMLRHLDMMPEASGNLQIFPATRAERIRVAVYDGAGAQNPNGRGPSWLRERLARDPGIRPELVGVPEILQGALERADVLIIGGGKANLESKALGDQGRSMVIQFVRNGGGFVGICAGAYLGSSASGKTACLELLPVETLPTYLECFTPLAWSQGPLGSNRVEDADLRGGPIFKIIENTANRVDVWARFSRNETHTEKGEYQIKDTPAIVSGLQGKGRVILTSTHCERAPSPSTHFPAMVRWVGQ